MLKQDVSKLITSNLSSRRSLYPRASCRIPIDTGDRGIFLLLKWLLGLHLRDLLKLQWIDFTTGREVIEVRFDTWQRFTTQPIKYINNCRNCSMFNLTRQSALNYHSLPSDVPAGARIAAGSFEVQILLSVLTLVTMLLVISFAPSILFCGPVHWLLEKHCKRRNHKVELTAGRELLSNV